MLPYLQSRTEERSFVGEEALKKPVEFKRREAQFFTGWAFCIA